MIKIAASSTVKKSTVSNISGQLIPKLLVCGVLMSTIISITYPAIAVSVKDVPSSKQLQGTWVTDMANILSPETEDKLNRSLSKLAATNGSEVAIVTVPETTPSATPKEFATELFNYWGIGKKGQDNGVLLLISKGDRRVEIEAGYGVEDVLPDALVGNIIREKITPQFKQGNFDKGTLDGTGALVAVLERKVSNTNALNSSQLEQSERNNWQLLYWLLGLGGITVAGVIYVKNRSAQEVACASVKPCPNCERTMKKVDASVLQPMLTQPQKVAQELGSVDFAAWHCANCQPQPSSLKSVHLFKFSHRSDFRNCPVCCELTVQRTSKVLQPATVESEGTMLLTDTCHCCSYQKQTEKTIDRLPPPPPPKPPASRNVWTNSSGSNWNSGSSSGGNDWGGSSGGYSGGSDWGGGSSGGGGAGDSW